jgi:DNA-binding LacI/PurR family transcriptional regulator
VPAPAAHATGKRPSPSIALLAGHLDDDYEWEIIQGACEAVQELGGRVVCFGGAALSAPDAANRARHFVFDLVSRANFDAVLCISSVLGHVVGSAEIGIWLERFDMPVASIGPAQAVTSVQVSDARGIARLVDHLVLHHGHRRIAFVSGLETNAEAKTRLSGFARALDEHGLDYGSKLVVHGNFTRESGVTAVCTLFDQRQIKVSHVDAIIAANDYMALGVIDELVRRRISVPEQVAVVGFDDINVARTNSPSLTTVRQPLRELGREGVLRVAALLAGTKVEWKTILQTDLVLRRSCGCVPTDIPQAPFGPESQPPLEARDDAAGQGIIQALTAEMQGNEGALRRALEPVLYQAAKGDPRELERQRLQADALAARLRAAHGDLFHERLHRIQRALDARMFGPTADLSTVLAEFLPGLGLNECVVAEFVPGSQRKSLRLAFGFDRENLRPQPNPFPAHELLPPEFNRLRTTSSFVLPVSYGAQSLGIAVLPASIASGTLGEGLAEAFGVALKGLEVLRRAEAK